jgi:hypothetical protein
VRDSGPTPFRVRDLPPAITSRCPFPPDYVDLFMAACPSAAAVGTAEDWARTTMEGASPTGRFLAWRVLCGLDLHQGDSPDHIAGWRVEDGGERWIRVAARSWFMTANAVFVLDDQGVWFATFVRYDRWVGRLIWTPVSAVHRAVAPSFLSHGVRRMLRRKHPTGSGR